MILEKLFHELNEKYFDSFLETPELAWNSRLRTCAGRFYAAVKRFSFTRAPRIEIASYLLQEPQGEQHVRDTLAHEMIHYWLWIRKRPSGHTAEFYKKLKEVGATRYNPVPKLRPYKHEYICRGCQRVFPTRKKIRALACLSCCKQYAGGKYDLRFKLVLKAPS